MNLQTSMFDTPPKVPKRRERASTVNDDALDGVLGAYRRRFSKTLSMGLAQKFIQWAKVKDVSPAELIWKAPKIRTSPEAYLGGLMRLPVVNTTKSYNQWLTEYSEHRMRQRGGKAMKLAEILKQI